MMLRVVFISLALFSAPAFAQAIAWTNYEAGSPLPVHAIIGGVEKGRSVPLCRGKSGGSWVPGKLLGHRCIIIEKRRPVPRRQAIQIALPGPSAHLLAWTNSKKAQPLRVDTGRPSAEAFCRGLYGGVLLLGRHVDGRCEGTNRNRARRIRSFEVLATHGAQLPVLQQATMAAPQVNAWRDFWADKVKRTDAAISRVESAAGFGLRPLLGELRQSAGLSIATVAAAFGKPIWLTGPHSTAQADLSQKKSFGRYNPAFVRWLIQSVPKPQSNPVTARMAMRIYKRSLAPIARTWFAVGKKIEHEPGCKALIRQQHDVHLRRGTPAWRSFELFMHPSYCRNPRRAQPTTWRRDLVGQAVAWWARREADGTAKLWLQFFTATMKTYDGSFATNPSAPALP